MPTSPGTRSPRAITAAAALLMASSTAFAGGFEPALPATSPVIVTHGLSDKEALWVAEQMTGEVLPEGTATLPLDAPAFLDPLRTELLLDQLDAYRKNSQACKALKGDLTSWLGKAVQRALELDKAGAEQAQTQAIAAFECGSLAASAGGVAQLMAIPGFISGYSREQVQPIATDETVRLFLDVFVVNPSAQLSAEHHGDIQGAFTAARVLSEKAQTVSIAVPIDQLPGVTLRIDGEAVTTPTLDLRAGRHFVQIVDRRGKSRYGATFVVGPPPLPADPIVVPSSMLPPTREALREALPLAAISGSLPPPTRAALADALVDGQHPWLVLAAPDPGADRLVGLRLDFDGSIEHLRFDPPRVGCAVANWSTALLGLAAVSGAALWAPAYMEKTQAIEQGSDWYLRGNTADDVQNYQQRITLGVGIGWGAVGLGIATLGASRAGGCAGQGGNAALPSTRELPAFASSGALRPLSSEVAR